MLIEHFQERNCVNLCFQSKPHYWRNYPLLVRQKNWNLSLHVRLDFLIHFNSLNTFSKSTLIYDRLSLPFTIFPTNRLKISFQNYCVSRTFFFLHYEPKIYRNYCTVLPKNHYQNLGNLLGLFLQVLWFVNKEEDFWPSNTSFTSSLGEFLMCFRNLIFKKGIVAPRLHELQVTRKCIRKSTMMKNWLLHFKMVGTWLISHHIL